MDGMPEILQSREEGVVTVTLNRPPQRNAINLSMWQALRSIADELAVDSSARCVVFRGAGEEAFSAGADIREFNEERYDSASAEAYAERFEGALDAIESLPQPTVSMIQGFCVGGGLELASTTDIRIASAGATFGVPVARLGIVAGFHEMRRIVNLIGPVHASYLMFSGALISAEEAARVGLINRRVRDDSEGSLADATYDLARRIAALAPISHRDHKRIIHAVARDPDLSRLSEAEREIQFRVFDTEDFQEGRAAFLEKRTPQFEGR